MFPVSWANIYNQLIPKERLCAYFFGPTPDRKRLTLIRELMEKFGIEMYSFDSNDIPYAHVPVEASNGVVKTFIENKMVRDNTSTVPWTSVRAALLKAAPDGKLPGNEALKTEFAKHGVRFVASRPSSEHWHADKHFRGFIGWKLAA
jgi:hypothetical protein